MLELRIMTGISKGAAFPLVEEEWSIGSHDDADIILLDPAIEPKHALLKKISDQWSLSAEQGKLIDGDGQPQERLKDLPIGHLFALDQTWMMIENVGAAWQEDITIPVSEVTPPAAKTKKPKSKKRHTTTFIFGFVCAVAVSVSSSWASFSRPSSQESDDIKADSKDPLSNKTLNGIQKNLTLTTPLKQAEKPPLAKLKSTKQVANELHTLLIQRELTNAVQVKVKKQKVVLEGQLPAAKLPVVSRMLERFNEQFETQIPIQNNVSSNTQKLPFTINQINAGKLASVIVNGNKRLFIGDEVDGLRLVAVEADKVVFAGRKHFEIQW